MRITGRRTAIVTACVAVVVVGAAAFVARDRIAEEWWIYRLGSKDDETRIHAAEKLAEMKSLRAVPNLVRIIWEDRREDALKVNITTHPITHILHLTPIAYSLYTIGPQANDLVTSSLQIDEETSDEAMVNLLNNPANSVLNEIEEAWAGDDLKVEKVDYTFTGIRKMLQRDRSRKF